MKRLAALLLATTCLTAPAHAEPITLAIAGAVGVELIAGTVAAAVATQVLTVAVGVGISLAASALLSKPSEQASDTSSGGSNLSVSYGAAVPRSAIMGPGAVGGHHVYTNVYGTTNEAMDAVFVIGDGRHGKLTRLKYNGKDCTLPPGGLAHGVVYAVPEFVFLGTPCVGITYYSGRYDQTADASLIAHSNPAGRWTTDHRGAGVAYLYVHQIYAEGDLGLTGIPQLMIETEGLVLYDPRHDSTNGGSDADPVLGGQRWGVIDTYHPSANPAIQEYNFRRGVLVNGQRLLGMSMSPVNLILQMYFAAANDNDDPIVLLAGGTEPRYRCSINISDDRAASSVLSAMRAATAGWSFERGGQFGPIPGVPQIPISALAFTDDDMIVGASARFTKYRSRSELVTATFGQFSDPAQFWVATAFPPRENLADDVAIGERIAKSLDLTQVYSPSQAQRIAESERRKTLQQGQGVATLPAKWIGVQPGDWLTYNSARHGTMTVLVTGTTLDTAKQQVTITYERTSNFVYSWSDAGELFPPEVGEGGQVGTLIMIAAGMSAVGVNLPGDGSLVTPGIHFTWTPIFDPTVDQIDFEIRKLGDTSILPFTAEFPQAGSAVCSGHGIAAATVYEYRHKLFTLPERDTPWSSWATVTSGTQHIVPMSLTSIPGDVLLASFEAGLRDYVGTQLQNGFERVARFEQLIASVAAEQEAANWLDLQISKDADVTITGQVSALSGGKTWRGDYSDTALYHANDMVRMPDGSLYSTPEDVQGIAPPAAPWVPELTAAIVGQEWRTFAGPDGAAAQTSESIEARFGSATLERSVAQVVSDWKVFAGTDFAAAQTSQSIEARFGADTLPISTATLMERWQAFAGPDYASAQTSESVEARFGAGTLPISVSQLITNWEAYAGPDYAVTTSETTVLARFGTNEASISTNATAIAGINGKLIATWQVTLDVNNYVTGLKFYNDGTTSDFVIITDNFWIARPSSSIGPTPVFTIGTRNGVAKLVMRGDMFVDGAVVAQTIAAGQISSVHVGTNLLIANQANIDNLVVKNVHIANAQITVADFGTHGGGGINAASSITLDVPITVFGVAGSTITLHVNGGFDMRGDGTTGNILWTCSLLETGATMDGGQAIAPNGEWHKVAVGGGLNFSPASGTGNALTARLSIQYFGGNAAVANVRLAFVAYLR